MKKLLGMVKKTRKSRKGSGPIGRLAKKLSSKVKRKRTTARKVKGAPSKITRRPRRRRY